MNTQNEPPPPLSRREFIQMAGAGTVALLSMSSASGSSESYAGAAHPDESDSILKPQERFPYFLSGPVSYLDVKMQDNFWAPRQRVVREVTIPWATRHYDKAGGLEQIRNDPAHYSTQIAAGDLEAIKFVEAMASAVGLERDPSIEALIDTWGSRMADGQDSDGYFAFGWPPGADPKKHWEPYWWSHEDFALGHYIESAITYREATGKDALYQSAVRGADAMASALLSGQRAYAPGHEEIEQALMRLYGLTGESRYLRLCGWLIGQRGHHEGRRSFGSYSQDRVPIGEQRAIEGHAVRAAFLFNGVTEYVGATGDAGYRSAVLAVWDDLVEHQMYLHGASGNRSAHNEGYGPKPDHLPLDDCYGESCAVFGNFQWAHSLFRLTGDARYLDTAERILYNAFCASLSLQGDRYFYCNPAKAEEPTPRREWHPVACCPPNIVKLFCKVGGFFYSTDKEGIFIEHYGESEARVPFGDGVKLIQRGNYPWDGEITVEVTPSAPTNFKIRLRIPSWAKSHVVSVNGKDVQTEEQQGWAILERRWALGDRIGLSLPMAIERVCMPPRFKEYAGLRAIQRGPIVYCLEKQDVPRYYGQLYLPENEELAADYRPGFLGGVTVIRGRVHRVMSWTGAEEEVEPAVFVPYCVWDNRDPGEMCIWLPVSRRPISSMLPLDPPGTT